MRKGFKPLIWCVFAVVVALSGLALLGWLLDIRVLRSFNPGWTAMTVATACCLLCSASVLVLAEGSSTVAWRRLVCRTLGVCVALIGSVSFLSAVLRLQSGQEPGWLDVPLLRSLFVAPARMAPLTAVVFIGLGVAFAFLTSRTRHGSNISHAITLPVALMSYLVLIGYLFGVDRLYTWLYHPPMALNTALAVCAVSAGLLLVRPDTWLMKVLVSPDAGGMLARRLLPAVVIVPVLIGWPLLAFERAGRVGVPLAAALMAIVNGFVMLSIVWLTARSANLADARRRRTEAALHESQDRYRALVEMSPDAVFVNRDNTIVEVNHAALRLLGAETAGQVVGKSPLDIFHPDYHSLIRERNARLLRGESVPLIEEKVVRLDGTLRDVEVAASAFREEQTLAVQVILRDISERKHAEEALRRQREWLGVTLTSIGDAVLATDAAGKVTFLNPVATGLTGWKPDEALGQPARDVFRIINEQTGEDAEDIIGRVLQEGRIVALANHTALVHRDGRIIPIEDSAAPIRDSGGAVAGAVLVFHDVTEKRRIQQALQNEGERLRQLNRTLKAHTRSDQALLLAVDEASYLQEVCRIIVEDCGHALVWVGFREDDEARSVRPAAWSGFEEGYLETLQITWADTERGRGPTGLAIRTGTVCACRNMLTDPRFQPWREQALRRGYASSIALPLVAGGQAFGALTIYCREPDPFSDDEVKLLTELARDFSYGINVLRLRAAHAQSEQALKESEERFRTLAESIPHSVWVTDLDGGLQYANSRLLEFRGLSQTSCRTWQIADGVHPEDLPRCEEAWADLVRNGEEVAFEYRMRRADGAWRWHLGRGRALRGEDGSVVRLIGTSTDIHDQKMAQEAARQAQKLESIGLLAGGIAHDFNNLLVGIIGNASLAQDMVGCDSPAVEILDRVVRSGEKAAHLTRQMLAYAGKGQFIVEPVNLSSLVRESTGLIQSSISKKIALRLELEPDIPSVEADASQMQQVFMNLALNAAEAIGAGSGFISVSTGEMSASTAYIQDELNGWAIQPGNYVYLEVRDNGCGMDAPTKARIFDPFFSTKFQGRGLGLAAVAGIVRSLHGAVSVASEPGAGTTFRVLFRPMAPTPRRSAPDLQVDEEDLAGHGTVLVVDDEEVVRDVARYSLERQGYAVLLADSGQAAIDAVRANGSAIELVILDLSMPGMSGEEALPHLRALQPDINIIVSSGYSEAEALRLFRGVHVSGFIQKPYTARDLAREVKAVRASRVG